MGENFLIKGRILGPPPFCFEEAGEVCTNTKFLEENQYHAA